MNINIRNEVPADYRIVEELTREAFWGNMDHPTCDGEHLLVHKLRKLPAFVPELDFVAEVDGEIVGHIIYSLAKIITPDNREIKVLNFGPLSVHPNYKRMGVGSALMHYSIAEAARQGYRAIIFYGHPDYYPRFGFKRASRYGIVSADGSSFDALMAMELYDGALDGITGRFIEDEVYEVDPEEMAEFEKGFPYKEPVELAPVEILTAQLPERVKQTFAQHEIKFVSQLQRFSGAELLNWDGMDEQLLKKINRILSQLGQPCKLLPSSYILQRTDLKE
ncbi:MAG: N-acetyltransferase [Lachnospiraceae bacterium]|nr:N-acetyltransferase [Lachnospiraceae bacterium]